MTCLVCTVFFACSVISVEEQLSGNLDGVSKAAQKEVKPKKKPADKSKPGLWIPDVARNKVICFALYTVHNKTLKLTAQLYPLKEGEDREVRLEIKQDGKWEEAARTRVIEQGWTATFRIENWDDSQNAPYRVVHGTSAFYEGLIRKNPIDAEEVVMACFTGNSINPDHGGDIPKNDIVENVRKIDADLLFFSGDQVYDHNRHYAAWLKFGRDFGEIIKDRPTITIPDDHDVGQRSRACPDKPPARSIRPYTHTAGHRRLLHEPDMGPDQLCDH